MRQLSGRSLPYSYLIRMVMNYLKQYLSSERGTMSSVVVQIQYIFLNIIQFKITFLHTMYSFTTKAYLFRRSTQEVELMFWNIIEIKCVTYLAFLYNLCTIRKNKIVN